MEIINLTKHDITLEEYCGEQKVYPKSEIVARVDLDYIIIGELDGYPIYSNRILKNNIPEPKKGVVYIVSNIVLQQMRYVGRSDCIAPDSNHGKRDSYGNIVSVSGWLF